MRSLTVHSRTIGVKPHECAEWLSDDQEKDCNGWSPEAIEQAKADCLDFQEANAEALAEYQEEIGYPGGVDFWLTRNRHGAGFWDRGNAPCFKALTDAAHVYGECDVYIGDA